MKPQTYQAESMAAALARVKRELGPGAVILHTRSFKSGGILGWNARTVFEITAMDGRQFAARDSAPSRRAGAALAERVVGRAYRDAPESPESGGSPPAEPGRDRFAAEQPSAVSVRLSPEVMAPPTVAAPAAVQEPEQLYREIETIRSMVADVLRESRRTRLPQFTDELMEMYTRLIGQQVADEIARRLIDEARAAAVEDHPDGAVELVTCQRRLMERIAGLLPDGEPLAIDTVGRPKVVALVGPTGVGKTTTIAKLAAHFKLRERRRVGLVTVDLYRIAAVEQLKVYAGILDVPLTVVMTPADMPAALERMRECELILVDTAGRSQRDAARIDELKQYLDAARPDEVHLVLAGTSAEAAVMETIRNFSPVSPHRLIFTKLDEAVGCGLILNVLASVGMRVSYLTNGQSVPNDIEVANGRRLAELILGASSPSKGKEPQ